MTFSSDRTWPDEAALLRNVERHGIDTHEVHVWLVNTCDTGPSRTHRSHGITTRSDSIARRKREQVISRALVRLTLSRYCTVDAGSWRFIHNEHGRPEIAPGQTSMPLRFNVSHTAGLLACGVTLNHDIGIDVEQIADPHDGDGLARRYFSPQEAVKIANAASADRRELFLSYWTLKEAFLKATGKGLSAHLDKVQFQIDGTKVNVRFEPELAEDPPAWRFERYRPTGDHLLALAVKCGKGVALRVQGAWVSQDELLGTTPALP